jgi:murein DD-endopeptidase MepM/ murein hydrolase activator NlpD
LGLSSQELERILSLGKETKILKSLYPEKSLRLLIQDSQLSELLYQEDPTKTLRVYKTGNSFTAETELVKPEVRVSMTTASVGSSLTLAGQEVGVSEKLMLQLIKMFGWDVDFVHEIEEGATFAVLYEEYFMDGVKIRDGDVLAATFTNRGKTYKAIRYLAEDGRVDYYDGEGHGKRRAFLRTPLKFTRISSYFNPHRKHPILHRVRAHNGVDYAAPQGTPVKATGDGKIHFVGGQSGYGKTVIIDHHSDISTLYAHLSGYARGIKEGQSVRQGEIIGYVGQTGLATGPHLHYEFRVNDVHQDPLKVALPEVAPNASKAMASLKAKAEKLFAQLDQLTQTHVSSAANPSESGEYSLAATNNEAGKKSTH